MNATNRKLVVDDSDISAGQRPIRDGKAFDRFFPPTTVRHLDKIEKKDGDVQDTLRFMERVVHTWKEDTMQLALYLKRDTTDATLEAIWNFLYHNIQYKLDRMGLEELRRPSRSWADRKTGIDCDDFAMFVSSLLVNLQIPHKLRVARYTADTWQHVYVVVPKGEDSINDYWTVDAVLSRYDYEKPYTDKMDYPMSLTGIQIAVLSGIAKPAQQPIHRTGSLAEAYDIIAGIDDEALSGANDEQKMFDFLKAMRTLVAADNGTMSAVTGEDKAGLLQALDYALTHWFSGLRLPALGKLAGFEQQLNAMAGFSHLNGLLGSLEDDLSGIDDDNILSGLMGLDGMEGLGRARNAKKKGGIRKFFSKVKQGIKNTVKKVGQTVKKVATKTWKVLKKVNPVLAAGRNGLLLAFKLNFGHMAERFKWAYATPEQAARLGTSPDVIARAKRALEKTENLFEKLGGNKDNIRKAILSAKKGKLSGIAGLEGIGAIETVEQLAALVQMQGIGDAGLGAVVAAAITTAMPIIIKVIAILKDAGLGRKEDDNIQNAGQAQEDAAADAGITEGNYTQSVSEYTPAAETGYEPESGYELQTQSYVPSESGDNYPSAPASYQAGELEGIGDGLQFIRDNAKVLTIGAVIAGGLYFMSKDKGSKPRRSSGNTSLAGVRRTTPKKPAVPKVSGKVVKTIVLN